MKVLIAVDTYLPRLGGGEVLAYQLATFLKREGHTVELITPEQGIWERDHEFPVHRPVFSRNPLTFAKFMWRYYRLIWKSDVVHSMCAHKMAALGGIGALLMGKKLAVTLIGHGILNLPHNTPFYAFIHRIYRTIALKTAHVVFDGSLEFREIARHYTSEEKIIRLPNSVDMADFSPGPKEYSLLPFANENTPLVFIVRRMVPKNGVQFLVESAPLVLAEVPNAHFVHIGWGPLEEYLKKRVRELGIEKNFHFLGRIENTKVQKFINLADVVVFPSTAESTSIACLESMALGKPIVASKVGGFPEMVTEGDNGLMVNLTDTEASNYDAPMTLPQEKLNALSSAIASVVKDPSLRARMGVRSRERIEQEFSWQASIKKIIASYD